jgi:hypothetical protein
MAEHGITVTEEGLARARAKLDAAGAKWTPERRKALREQLGLPVIASIRQGQSTSTDKCQSHPLPKLPHS